MAYSPTSIIIISVVLPILSIVAVSLRIWVRLKVFPTHIGADDWLAIVSCVLAVGYSADLIVGATVGFSGQDWPDQIPPQRYTAGKKLEWAQQIMEKVLYASIKLSAVFFFRRIFAVNQRFARISKIVIISICVWAIVFLFITIFECGVQPWQLWTPGNERLGCLGQTRLNLSYTVTDSLLDTIVIIMPFPLIRHLHVQLREKLALASIFMLFALSTVAAYLRLAFIAQAVPKDYSGAGNKHGAATPVDVWCMIEATVGTLAVSLPPLAPLLRSKAWSQAWAASRIRSYPATNSKMNGTRTMTATSGKLAHTDPPNLVLGQKGDFGEDMAAGWLSLPEAAALVGRVEEGRLSSEPRE